MKVYPVSSANHITTKGSLDRKTADMLRDMSGVWLSKASEMKTPPLINTCLFASERINNVFINLSTMMERFGHACKLTFAKSEKSSKYRFYIENEYSNYKSIFKDIEFSQGKNKLDDITRLENLENALAKIDPYQENSKFLIQRKSNAKDISFDKNFEPDTDYLFIEDKLVGKEEKPQATMEDIKEFLEAAKEEGLIDG